MPKTLILLPLLASPAFAAVVLPAGQDNNTLKSANTTVQPNGATLLLKVANGTQTNSRNAFFQFSTASLLPTDGNDAVFNFSLGGNAGTDFSINLYALNAGATAGVAGWTETGITWNNSPAFSSSGTYYLNAAQVTSLGSVSIIGGSTAGTSYTVAIPDFATYNQTTNSSITLIMVVTSQTSGTETLSITSAENTTYSTPNLTIIPEPSTLALGAAGSLALFRRRRLA